VVDKTEGAVADETEGTVAEVEDENEPVPKPSQPYHLHIVLEEDMKQTLKDSAELAHKMGDIPKADLVNLMNLFITWGLAIQKQKWLDYLGYK
jgi:hypothetical protein